MPCAKGMYGCKPSCAHRRLVEEYQLARHAQLLDEEAATIGDPEMIKERRENGLRPVNFKEWLVGTGRADGSGFDPDAGRLEVAQPPDDGAAW